MGEGRGGEGGGGGVVKGCFEIFEKFIQTAGLPQVNYMNIIMLMLICGVESSDYWELAFKNNSKYFLLRSLLGSGYTLWSN